MGDNIPSWGRGRRRIERETARQLVREIMHQAPPQQLQERVGFILTYWGVLFSWIIGGYTLMDHHAYLASACFFIAVAQIVIGLWVWLGGVHRYPVRKIAGTLLVLALFVWWDWYWLTHRVIITPSDPVVFDSHWVSDAHVFTVENTMDEDAYKVAIILRLKGKSLTMKDFKFDVPNPSGSQFNAFEQMCTDSKNGDSIMSLSIFRLRSHEKKEFSLDRLKPERATVQADVEYYEKTSAGRIVEPGLTGFPFMSPARMTCDTVKAVVI